MNMDMDLTNELTQRLARRIDLLRMRTLCGVDIVVAGGALLAKSPHDFDVYAASSDAPLDISDDGLRRVLNGEGWRLLSVTANALTYKDPSDRIFQFCSYAKPTPQLLIESFDFAHCQVGLVVRLNPNKRNVYIPQAVFTPDFVKAMTLENTYFTGSEYPLSSLVRIVKYVVDGRYGKGGRRYMPDILRILTAIVDRGFKDYDDFKDQLDAVDLNYAGNDGYALWRAIEKRFTKNGES